MGIDLILKRFQVRILLGGFPCDDILDQRIDLIQEDVETLGDGADFIGSFDGQPFIEIVVYDIVDFFDLMVDEPENLADIPIEVEDNHEETQVAKRRMTISCRLTSRGLSIGELTPRYRSSSSMGRR